MVVWWCERGIALCSPERRAAMEPGRRAGGVARTAWRFYASGGQVGGPNRSRCRRHLVRWVCGREAGQLSSWIERRRPPERPDTESSFLQSSFLQSSFLHVSSKLGEVSCGSPIPCASSEAGISRGAQGSGRARKRRTAAGGSRSCRRWTAAPPTGRGRTIGRPAWDPPR